MNPAMAGVRRIYTCDTCDRQITNNPCTHMQSDELYIFCNTVCRDAFYTERAQEGFAFDVA